MNFPKVFLLCALLGIGASSHGLRAQTEAHVAEAKAVFAGGCFWCMQPPFDRTPGVISTLVGYAGGSEENPTYKQVSAGETSHREAIEVTYDAAKVTYEQLLDVFWHNISPVQTDGQFNDVGDQYTTAVFYATDAEKTIADASKETLGKSGRFTHPIATAILPAGKFWPAEAYHQKYYIKNRASYGLYHFVSGRDSYKQRTWGSAK